MTSRWRWLGPALAVAAALVGVFLLQERADQREPAPPAGTGPDVAAPWERGDRSAPTPVSPRVGAGEGAAGERGDLPRSLAGTDVDGGFHVDADGALVPTPDAIALFNYFLAASGEEPAAVIEARIRDEIARRLGPPADADANVLLDQYLALRIELRALTEERAVPHELERRLQWIRELRRAHFGAETARALFGEQEDAMEIDLARRRVARDPTLGPAERAEALAALEAALPERVREARQRAAEPVRSRQEVAALRAAGASEAAIFAAREREFGYEAAERLAALDAERAVWQERLAAYRLERDQLRSTPSMSEAERESEITTLRARHFDERERLRVAAMDRADG